MGLMGEVGLVWKFDMKGCTKNTQGQVGEILLGWLEIQNTPGRAMNARQQFTQEGEIEARFESLHYDLYIVKWPSLHKRLV